MAAFGKELEPKNNTDELAAKEVEGYIERIEKQAEIKQVSVVVQPTNQPASGVADLAAKQIMAIGPKVQKQKILLPLNEEEITLGLHHKVWEAIRWLAEWSMYMIKKYPGRVFYPPERESRQGPDRQ